MDTQNLDTFTQFIEFIKNIDNFSTAIDQFKQVTKDQQVALDLLTQGKTLKEYEDKIESAKVRLAFERQEFDRSSQAANDVLTQRAKDLNDRELDLNARKSELDILQSTLTSVNANQLEQRNALLKKESDLNVQIDKNNQVAEDLASRFSLLRQAGA